MLKTALTSFSLLTATVSVAPSLAADLRVFYPAATYSSPRSAVVECRTGWWLVRVYEGTRRPAWATRCR